MPLMRINYYDMQKMKSWFRNWEGLLSKALARSMYPHLTEDSEIFFEVGSDGALFEKYDDTSHHLECTDEGLNYAKSWGCRNVYNVFGYHTNESKAEYKIGLISIKLINEVNIVNSVQPLQILSVVAVRILGHNEDTKPSTQTLSNYYSG